MSDPGGGTGQKGRRGLGRGLDALLGGAPLPGDEPALDDASTEAQEAGQEPAAARAPVQTLPIDAIQPNPYQPRKHFDPEGLSELADSIRLHGLIQPLLVTEQAGGYTLIAGERRWQAARQAGLEQVPVVLREADPEQMLALAIIENVQRADLDPLEAAAGYKRLIEEFGLTQAAVARLVGKSRPAVANAVRLLGLSDDVQRLVAEGRLSEGHARALLGIKRVEDQLALAKQAIAGAWTVRRVENEVRKEQEAVGEVPASGRKSIARPAAGTDPDTAAAVEALERALGTRVEIRRKGQGGQLVIHFYSEEELAAVYEILAAER